VVNCKGIILKCGPRNDTIPKSLLMHPGFYQIEKNIEVFPKSIFYYICFRCNKIPSYVQMWNQYRFIGASTIPTTWNLKPGTWNNCSGSGSFLLFYVHCFYHSLILSFFLSAGITIWAGQMAADMRKG